MATGDTITISGQNSLSEDVLAEALALKDACDAYEQLDLKLGYGAVEQATAPYASVLLARAGQRLVGYCSLDGDATTAEICGIVHPDWRRHRLGMRLFEAARASFTRAGGGQLFAVCEDGSASGRAFLRMLAAQRAFSEHRMVWQGDAHTPPALDDDQSGALIVARAGPEDYHPLAVALAHAFDHTEGRLLADLTTASTMATEQVYAARLDGAIIGGFRLSRMPDSTGIYAFGIDPAWQRQGWGRHMLAQACALAQENPQHQEPSDQRVTLEVDTDNTPAIALYRASGFETVTTYGYYVFPPTLLATGLTLHTGDDANNG